MASKQKLIAPARVAEKVDRHVNTLCRWAANGDGPPFIPIEGHHLRVYDSDEVDAWIASGPPILDRHHSADTDAGQS